MTFFSAERNGLPSRRLAGDARDTSFGMYDLVRALCYHSILRYNGTEF